MRTRTTWMLAGGAAAFVLTPIVSVYGSTALDTDLEQSGVVVDADSANRARAERVTAERTQTQPAGSGEPSVQPSPPAGTPTANPGAKSGAASTKAKPSAEPTGKKTVSAASPVSPKTSPSPISPPTPS